MKKPIKYLALGASAFALFATTYFTIFAVMGVPIKEAPLSEQLLGVERETGAPTKAIVSSPAPTPDPVKVSTQRASDVLGAFVLPAGVQAETLRSLKTELYQQLEQVRSMRDSLGNKEQSLYDREIELSGRFDELLALRSRLDEFHLELQARAEELNHEETVRDKKRTERLTDMSTYLIDGEASHAAALLSGMDPADAAHVLDVLEPERAGEILRSMSPEASRMVWEAGLAQDG
jgi:flagellar motility protein MotE (MotC chaperone)